MGHWTIEVLFQSLEGISLSFRSASNFFNLFFLFFAFFLWSDKNLVRRERKRLMDLSLLSPPWQDVKLLGSKSHDHEFVRYT